MSAVSELIFVLVIMFAIFAFVLLIVVGIACVYYGAILIVLLSILKWFGIIALVAVV